MSTSTTSISEVCARYGLNYDLPIDDAIHNVLDLLQPKLRQYSEKTAFRMGEVTLSFAQIDIASQRFAAFLQAQGFNKGDRVAVQLPNILQYPVVILGCLRAGVILVNVNPLYTQYELAHQLLDAKVKGLVVVQGMDSAYQNLEEEVKQSLDWVMHCALSGDSSADNDILALQQLTGSQPRAEEHNALKPSWDKQAIKFADVINHHHQSDFKPVSIGRQDLALLQYTGGTTGKPKGAMLTHFNLVANIRAIAEQWKAVTGQTINEGYGMSETSPVISFNPPSITDFNGTVGLPLSLTQIKVIDDTGSECEIGSLGEVCIKGPQVMSGYWERDNHDTFTADGYFKSGDIGFVNEEGFVTLVDRKKDMILVSGFNVYPNEVEAVLTEHPKVVEVAVVGVADKHSGEVPKAFVVKKQDDSTDELTVEELQDFARERMTGYKRPKYYEFITELPKSAVGKILRKELR